MDTAAFVIHSNSVKDKKISGVQTVINNIGSKESIKIKVEIDKKNYFKDFKLKITATFNSKSPKPILHNH